jgi:[CysO sulfur-carrier protein]-S-L-cysteine hydrolase
VSGEVTVAVYEVRSDGEIAKARLAADGIASRLSVDDEGGLNPGFFSRYGVRLVVNPEDLGDAFASLGIERVLVPAQVADAMFKHSGWAYPEEACGVVAIDGSGRPVLAICLSNADHAADRFTIAPDELFGAIRHVEGAGRTIGAVFHSHPHSDAYPSGIDVGGGADPAWLHFIVGPVVGPRPLLRAFRINGGVVTEVNVTVEQ